MAQATETTPAVQAEEQVTVKATKEAKARRADGGVEYLHPETREWHLVRYEDECEAVKDFMEFYGRKQKFADFVWTPTTVSKKGVPGPSQADRFQTFLDAMEEGGFDERSGAATPVEKVEKAFGTLSPEDRAALIAKLQAMV